MSLVSDGPHTVKVYLEETVTNWRGAKTTQPSSKAVTITGCMMQPVSSARGAFAAVSTEDGGNPGQDVLVAYKLLARTAPVGWWSRVEWFDPDEGRVRKFSILGGPQNRRYSPLSSHVSVTLQEER